MINKYRVHEIVEFDYSEIGEYIDENHTDRPLRNDEICKLLNENEQLINFYKDFQKDARELEKENEQLKSFKDRVFNLLADEIKEETKLLDYYIEEKAPCNANRQQIIIGVLKRLQKELEE